MPTTEVVALQKQVHGLAAHIVDLRKRVAILERSLAGGLAAGGALEALPVSAGIRAKLGLAGLLTVEQVRELNEADLMNVAGLRRTDARKVRAALRKVDK